MGQDILDRVLSSPRLPSLPMVALEVIELVQQEDVSIDVIAETIQNDPALSSKILRTVNSSFYGQSQSVSTISQALVILGLNSVKTLALGFSLVNNLKENEDDVFDHLMFWKRSLYSAVAARSLIQQQGLVQQEEAFLGALMQDLGMLAMAQTLDGEYQSIVAEAGSAHRQLIVLERQHLGTDHAEIGAALADHWSLPKLLVEPIRHHEDPTAAPDDLLEMIKCVALGSRMADVFTHELPGEALDIYYQRATDWLGMAREEAEPLLKSIHDDTVEMRRLFDLPTGNLGDADEILAKAHEAMVAVSMQAAQESSELHQQNKALKVQATTDPLTGVANRGYFNDWIAKRFTAAGPGKPLSILFLDVDHFKSFNDTYGHQVGDRVLVELAKALAANTPQTGLVARYGGEEFAVVLPDTDRTAAATVAETLRKNIEQIAITSDEDELLTITASIGVAAYEGSVFARVEQLIKAADQAVYAAKSAGRNCVRVFVPRRRNEAA